jgi:hypothetical protein
VWKLGMRKKVLEKPLILSHSYERIQITSRMLSQAVGV